MLAKLSLRNARRQTGDYMVYFITITLAAALIYAFNALVVSPEINTLSASMGSLPLIVALTSVVVVAILGWLVYYTQRFMLMKRSRELATYVLLGVENRQVARMFLLENLAVGGIALALGFLAGNLICQGLRAVVFSLFGLPFTLSFGFPLSAVGLTFAYFAAIFLFSMLLCRRKIRKMSIRDMMDLDRQNEDKVVQKSKSRRWMFTASLVCAGAGIALMLTGSLGPGILGAFLIILFCYGFFLSFSSGVPSFFEKRPAQKYKKGTLLIFRSLSTKLASMGVTMGTIALLFTAALMAEGTALLFQNQFDQNVKLTTAFDMYIAAPAEYSNMHVYTDYIEENVDVTAQLRYTNYNAEDDRMTQFVKGRIRYWTFYDYDQVMRYSDYAALRAMLGYAPAPLGEGEYIIHCMEHLQPVLQNYTEDLTLGGASLKKGAMYNEVLTQFTWDGNGRGFLVVVPDGAAAGLTPSLDAWAMMTAAPLDEATFAGFESIRDARSEISGNTWVFDTLYAKSAVKSTYASMSTLVVFPLFYMALMLVMVAVTILTIQFLSDAKKYRRQYAILDDLGMGRREMRKTLNRHFLLFYAMPVIPPILISVVFLFATGQAFDPGIIISAAHLWGIIGICLALFFAIYLLYTFAAAASLKKTVLPA